MTNSNLYGRLGRGVFTSGEDTHTLRLKSELFDLRVGYANPILRLRESQRGVREPLTVAKNKDTRKGCPYFLAQEEGFEPPCLLGKRFSRRNTLSDFRRN